MAESDPLYADLEERLRFEALLADVSAQFVDLDPGRIDDALREALERLVTVLEIDRCTIAEFVDDQQALVFTHHYARPGIPGPPVARAPIAAFFPDRNARLLRGEIDVFESIEELPRDSPDREHLTRARTQSGLTIPLSIGGCVKGAMSFSAVRVPRRWPPDLVNRLRLVAQVFAGALARKQAGAALREAAEDRIAFERLITDLASAFVDLDAAGVDAGIERAIARLGHVLEADRGGITQFLDEHGTLVFTHTWSRAERGPIVRNVVAANAFPFGFAHIMRGEVHAFGRLDELPADAPDRAFFAQSGTKASVTVPFVDQGRVIGSLGFASMRERHWAPDVVNRLLVVAQIFASVLGRKRAERELTDAVEDRLSFEALIADIASRFVDLDPGRFDEAIQDAQRRLVLALGVDRSSLFLYSEPDGRITFTHTWTRPGLPGVTLPPQLDSGTLFPWIAERIRRGEIVSFATLDELPDDMPDRENARRLFTRSNVTIPLASSGRGIGALSFAAVRQERSWSPDVVNRLRLVGQVFASALARKRAVEELRTTLEENERLRERLAEENVYLQSEVRERQGASGVIGQSPAIARVLAEVHQVAPANATVLIQGETGTGKELIATEIHARSPRRAHAMVRVNCAAIPSALIESELFGREKGAYTGALARQVGRFELADGSTLFLDEIGELSLDVQVKLLRVLQERQIERLGSSRPITIDVRIIAATNRDLERAVAEGTFREDLYYRLNVFPIRVPPLRERAEDIPALVWAFVDEFSRALGKPIESISKDHLQALQRYPWPGNIRELRNTVERAVIVAAGPRLVIDPPRPRAGAPARRSLQLQDVERDHVLSVLEQTGWRVRGSGGAAEVLGLKPSTLEDRMARLGLRRPTR